MRVLDDWYGLLSSGMRVTGAGGSGSHYLLYSWAGYPRTYVHLSGSEKARPTPKQVRDAIKAGHATVSNGPFVLATIDGKGPGETVRIQDTARLKVTIQRPPWIPVQRMTVVVNGEGLETRRIPKTGPKQVATRLDVSIPMKEDGWCVVIVEGDDPLQEVLPWARTRPFAFTNPIFVERI
jgi:hypothetical protein